MKLNEILLWTQCTLISLMVTVSGIVNGTEHEHFNGLSYSVDLYMETICVL